MNCAHCDKKFESSNIVCDNDCLTEYCANCAGENYLENVNGQQRYLGIHDPNCGCSSSSEEEKETDN